MSQFRDHLYYEDKPESKEYQIMKCFEVLGLIARAEDRIISGMRPRSYIATISRLKKYYDYCVSNIEKFG